ncbi:hypothetical protein PR202_ga00642 [Eleusine coracana subsp. coracana]|uniref:Uncharacterized protein n=1 Tax=Eleusine coracana subsp. coracana TaxID=191504 RepID=A0AAV5BHM5_ELECO|nr:hypothetical protein PR202_ga00642 [Eleusine coracana subsp. coracana]
MRVHGVGGDPLQLGLVAAGAHGLLSLPWRVPHPARAAQVVGPHLGPHPLRHRLRGPLLLRDGQLRVGPPGVLRPRRGPARHAGRVHPGRARRAGLLRREPGGRVQPARAGAARGPRGGVQLRAHGVHGGPERRVPRGAAGGARRGRRGVQERVRGVRVARALLQWRARRARHVRTATPTTTPRPPSRAAGGARPTPSPSAPAPAASRPPSRIPSWPSTSGTGGSGPPRRRRRGAPRRGFMCLVASSYSSGSRSWRKLACFKLHSGIRPSTYWAYEDLRGSGENSFGPSLLFRICIDQHWYRLSTKLEYLSINNDVDLSIHTHG